MGSPLKNGIETLNPGEARELLHLGWMTLFGALLLAQRRSLWTALFWFLQQFLAGSLPQFFF